MAFSLKQHQRLLLLPHTSSALNSTQDFLSQWLRPLSLTLQQTVATQFPLKLSSPAASPFLPNQYRHSSHAPHLLHPSIIMWTQNTQPAVLSDHNTESDFKVRISPSRSPKINSHFPIHLSCYPSKMLFFLASMKKVISFLLWANKLIFTHFISVVTAHGYIVRCTGTDEICLHVTLKGLTECFVTWILELVWDDSTS